MNAARLRTLPLAVSGIIMGAAVAFANDGFNPKVSALAVVTALLIQIFSNFANDYGDSQKGTDNLHRVGPQRTIQSGAISMQQMKTGMAVLIFLSLASGIWLVAEGTKGLQAGTFILFLLLGVGALVAAYKYTAGSNPYGYAGFGDLAVFLFFGILPVAGTYFLNTHKLSFEVFLPAISIGLFSTGVLNLNNIRDIENDRNSGKNTLVVKMGGAKAKRYHSFLIASGLLSMIIFSGINRQPVFQWLFLVSFPMFIRDLVRINRISEPREFDPFLKKLSLSTLLFTLLYVLGNMLAAF